MHRSGTSWLAGSLEELGLPMGEVSTSDPHNRKGNRENPVLMSLHDAVLAESGGSWKRVPERITWSEERRRELEAHIASMNARFPEAWGFKDPRALLLLDEWKRQVGELVRVGIFRHPLAVHRSLAARNPRFEERRSLSLWNDYNERLIAEHRQQPFPILRFDVSAEALAAGLSRAAKTLELPGAQGSSGFFDEELVHNNESAAWEAVPKSCRELWDYLAAQVAAP
jgi:hypothetical protein